MTHDGFDPGSIVRELIAHAVGPAQAVQPEVRAGAGRR